MAAKQVIIKGVDGTGQRKRAIANEAITPGHLIEFITGSAATSGRVKKHATARGNQQRMFADVQDYIGQGLSTDYASGDEVNYVVAKSGDEVNALLKASENAGIGSLLESAGDGTLQVHTPSSAGGSTLYKNSIVGQALDSSNVATVARIRVEVA